MLRRELRIRSGIIHSFGIMTRMRCCMLLQNCGWVMAERNLYCNEGEIVAQMKFLGTHFPMSVSVRFDWSRIIDDVELHDFIIHATMIHAKTFHRFSKKNTSKPSMVSAEFELGWRIKWRSRWLGSKDSSRGFSVLWINFTSCWWCNELRLKAFKTHFQEL